MWLTELQTRYMHGYQATPGAAPASLVILFILLIAVLHGDALEPPALADRRRGLLYRQPVPDGLVGFAVQGGVQHALQSEISVRFLHYPNESFQLVDVELQVHAVCQPSAHDTHGAGVPLIK